MCINIEMLVNQVESILLAVIAQDVLFLVSISQFHYFASNQVADASS
jgi:hypothetical protein